MSKADIAAEAVGLEPGQQIRTVCPFCGGGDSRERSLSIKLDSESGLILYHCFRGRCAESGVLGGGKLGQLYTYKAEPKVKPPFDDSHVFELGGEDDTPSYLAINKINSWGLGLADYRWGYDTASGRLAIPVYGPVAELRGYVLRALTEHQKPKALTGVVRRDDPFIGWIGSREPKDLDHVIVVEDVPSAIRVGKCGYQAVALCGNSPSDAALDELRSAGRGRKIVFALDPDATVNAIVLVRRYGLRGSSSVLVLQKDFKNMTDKEASDWLKNVT